MRSRPRVDWYLMNAFALIEKRKAKLDECFKHWNEGVIFVVRSDHGREMFCHSSGDGADYNVGQRVTWMIDTGNGLKSPSFEHERLIIENIITHGLSHINSKEVVITSKRNNIGLEAYDRRPIWVFK